MVGLFCVHNSSIIEPGSQLKNILSLASNGILLPLGCFMIIIGMYVLNDLVDSDLDHSNGKKLTNFDRAGFKGRCMDFYNSYKWDWIFVSINNVQPCKHVYCINDSVNWTDVLRTQGST